MFAGNDLVFFRFVSFQKLFFHKANFLLVFFLLFLSLSSGIARAEVTIGWQNNVDPTKFFQGGDEYRKIIGQTPVWKHFDNDAEALHALSFREVQFVPVDSVALLSAATVGLQLRVIAIAAQVRQESALVVSNTSQINKPSELVGKKIATTFLSNEHYSLLRALEHWHITSSQVQIINMKASEILSAWREGKIDGAYVTSTTLIDLKKTGHVIVDSGQVADWGYPTYIFWTTMDEIISLHSSLVQFFVNATLENLQNYRQNRAAWTVESKAITAIANLVKYSPTDTLTLLQGSTYPGKKKQKKLLTDKIPSYLGEMGLFLKNQNVLPNVLPDYLLYVDAHFVNLSE